MLKLQSVQPSILRVCDSVKLDSGATIQCVTGQVSSEEIVSQNGYRYRKGFWKKVLDSTPVISAIENRDMFGMIEHPLDDDAFLKTPYDGASHIVMKAWCDAKTGNPYAKFGILNNKNGNDLKALLEVGHKPGVSTRGMGNYGNDGVSQYVDEDGYVFLTWDIVRSPNFADLKMEKVTDSLMRNPLFAELSGMNQLRDSADEHYDRSKLVEEMSKAIGALTNVKDLLIKTL